MLGSDRLWAPYQHMEHARYRAIEEGLPLSQSRFTRVIGRNRRLWPDFCAGSQHLRSDPNNQEGWKPRVLDARKSLRRLNQLFFSQVAQCFNVVDGAIACVVIRIDPFTKRVKVHSGYTACIVVKESVREITHIRMESGVIFPSLAEGELLNRLQDPHNRATRIPD